MYASSDSARSTVQWIQTRVIALVPFQPGPSCQVPAMTDDLGSSGGGREAGKGQPARPSPSSQVGKRAALSGGEALGSRRLSFRFSSLGPAGPCRPSTISRADGMPGRDLSAWVRVPERGLGLNATSLAKLNRLRARPRPTVCGSGDSPPSSLLFFFIVRVTLSHTSSGLLPSVLQLPLASSNVVRPVGRRAESSCSDGTVSGMHLMHGIPMYTVRGVQPDFGVCTANQLACHGDLSSHNGVLFDHRACFYWASHSIRLNSVQLALGLDCNRQVSRIEMVGGKEERGWFMTRPKLASSTQMIVIVDGYGSGCSLDG